MKKFLYEIKDYIIIIIVVVLVRSFIITPAIVDGASMDNTLNDGNLVIINKFIYRFKEPERFQIVVVKNDTDRDKIIKRIIGLPGETLEYKDNKLYINGELVEENYIHGETENFNVKVSDRDTQYAGLGSKDSRILGGFQKKDIVGKVNFRIYPFDKFGILK